MPMSLDALLTRIQESLSAHPRLRSGDRVLVAMSGGVDSSVVAASLHRLGYGVTGVSMKLHSQDELPAGSPCGSEAFPDARRVAQTLGFAHEVVDFQEDFATRVIAPFASEYASGKTPNPCSVCNKDVKFDKLVELANAQDIPFVATGHYASITFERELYRLTKARDANKDQSYFLFALQQDALARSLFPLGSLTKPEVRALGQNLGLHLAEKAESQDICFAAGETFDTFLESRGLVPSGESGPIRLLADGRVLGTHQGAWRYTIGQRRGIGVAHAHPLYVVKVDTLANTVWLGTEEDLMGTSLLAAGVTWCASVPDPPFPCMAKIRSRGQAAAAWVTSLENGHAHVVFTEPQRAITPGQAVVFYKEDEVLGGGWILHQL